MYDLIRQEGASVRTRYYERATLLIKRAVLLLILQPYLVGTHYMLADLFTKALDKSSFVRHRNILMNVNVRLRDALSIAGHAVHGDAYRLVARLARIV